MAKIAADIFKAKKNDYLLIVDYYSNITVVKKLRSYNAKSIIEQFNDIFMIYGLPTVMVSDNGPSFASKEFEEFLQKCTIR